MRQFVIFVWDERTSAGTSDYRLGYLIDATKALIKKWMIRIAMNITNNTTNTQLKGINTIMNLKRIMERNLSKVRKDNVANYLILICLCLSCQSKKATNEITKVEIVYREVNSMPSHSTANFSRIDFRLGKGNASLPEKSIAMLVVKDVADTITIDIEYWWSEYAVTKTGKNRYALLIPNCSNFNSTMSYYRKTSQLFRKPFQIILQSTDETIVLEPLQKLLVECVYINSQGSEQRINPREPNNIFEDGIYNFEPEGLDLCFKSHPEWYDFTNVEVPTPPQN